MALIELSKTQFQRQLHSKAVKVITERYKRDGKSTICKQLSRRWCGASIDLRWRTDMTLHFKVSKIRNTYWLGGDLPSAVIHIETGRSTIARSSRLEIKVSRLQDPSTFRLGQVWRLVRDYYSSIMVVGMSELKRRYTDMICVSYIIVYMWLEVIFDIDRSFVQRDLHVTICMGNMGKVCIISPSSSVGRAQGS